MAARRRMGYGTDAIPKANAGGFPLPPPPDGKPPVRLPFGEKPRPEPVVDDTNEGQEIDIVRLLQSMGKV